jgi:hypothetical protein
MVLRQRVNFIFKIGNYLLKFLLPILETPQEFVILILLVGYFLFETLNFTVFPIFLYG